MNATIQKIHEAFDRKGLKHRVDQLGNASVIQTGMSGKASTYQFLIIKENDEGHDATIRVMKLAHFPPERHMDAYKLLNSFQQDYRYAKFVLDKDGDVYMTYEFPTTCADIGPAAVEILLRLANIVDQCYPRLMQLLWR